MGGDKDELFGELLEHIYAAVEDPTAWKRFLDRAAGAFDGFGSLISHDFEHNAAGIMESSGFEGSYLRQYADHYGAVNCFMPGFSNVPAGTILTTEAMLPLEAVKRTEYYNDWMRPQDLQTGFAGVVCKTGALLSIFTVLRSGSRGSLNDAELALVRRLLPHLQRAIGIRRELIAAKSAAAVAFESYDRLAIGIAIVGADRQLRHCNRAAEEIFRAGESLRVVAGRVRAVSLEADKALGRIIAGAFRRFAAQDDEGTLVAPAREGPGVSVYATAADAADRLIGEVMLILKDRSRAADLEPATVQGLYGLTAAQARLLVAILSGDPLATVAERLGIRLNTAKTHLKEICAKLGVSRQGQVIGAVLRDPVLALASARKSS